MTARKNLWPRAAEVLQSELARYRKTHSQTQNQIADLWGIHRGDFSECVAGRKHPSKSFITKFANGALPRPGDKEARAKLTALINEAATAFEPSLTLRKKLKTGADLRVTTIDYAPFAGTPSCLFESVFSRFLDLAGIHFDPPTNRRGFRSEDYEKSDFSLGLFDSADRMLTLDRKFFRVPIRMGLGAICLRKHQRHAMVIAHILSNPDEEISIPIRPIVVANDVGWRQCLSRLRLPDKEVKLEILPGLDFRELAGCLLEADKDKEIIPVICTDEFTCLRVLGELGQKGYSAFPMNSWRTGQDEKGSTRRELPQYYSSVGVDGNDRDFQEFMQDALEQFLSTEIETTARSWSNLAESLAKILSNISRNLFPSDDRYVPPGDERLRKALSCAHAWEWVFYTLNLDLKSIETYPNFNNLPFKPILLRARAIVRHHLAAQSQLLTDLVDLLWSSDDGKDRLCSLLDVDLGHGFRNLPRPYIVSALQRELTGARALPINVDDYDPNTDGRAALAMRRFMRSLQNIYDGLDRQEAVDKLGGEVDGMMTRTSLYGSESGRVILARLAEDNSFIGGACLQHNKKLAMSEIRYLWVESQYRGYNVGKEVIKKAIKLSAGENFKSKGVYVEVLEKVLTTAAMLVREMGFVDSEIEPTVPGRKVLEYRHEDHLS